MTSTHEVIESAGMEGNESTRIDVILCTYNPRPDFFSLALRSIGAQSLPKDLWNFVVVDNNSDPAMSAEEISRIAGVEVNLIVETNQGLTQARVAGLRATSAEVIVFVDDDNELDPFYLENVNKIVNQHAHLGTFGGISEGVLEKPVGKVKRSFLPYLGIRDYGQERIEGGGSDWGQWEPIGAGMVVVRPVANAFVDYVSNNGHAEGLGRSGKSLLSGEDSLFSRLADQLGYKCAYEPALHLRHYMARSRLTYSYLARLIYGHGRSFVLLAQALGRSLEPPLNKKIYFLLGNFWFRAKSESIVTAAGMVFWDSGFYDELLN